MPIAALIELVQLAERLGYDSVWVAETWGADAVSVLAVLAASTERITLASGVFNVYSRSAALLAQTAATLQTLSGGRFVLGLGTSGPLVVERWHGVPFRRPIGRTREYVDIIRMALAGETVTYRGQEANLDGFRLLNPPSNPVPVYIAALGPQNVRLTGEVADGWLPIFAVRGHLAPLFNELRAGMEHAHRSPDQMSVAAYLPVAIGPSGDRLLRQQLAYYNGGMGTFYAVYVARLGFGAQTKVIRDRWTAGERLAAVAAVDDDLLAVCTLGQEPEAARARLEGYRADGITLPVVVPPHGSSVQQIADSLAALAPGGWPLEGGL